MRLRGVLSTESQWQRITVGAPNVVSAGVPVVPVDLTSEYPSVDALLGIWDVLTAARLTTKDATGEVRALLAKVTLDDSFQPKFWKQLNFYARIVPEGDILPVRSMYDSKSAPAISA